MSTQARDVEQLSSMIIPSSADRKGRSAGRPPKEVSEKIILRRLQIKLTEKGFARIENLKSKTEALAAADVVRDALRVYEALVEAVSLGKIVVLEAAEDPSRREVIRLF